MYETSNFMDISQPRVKTSELQVAESLPVPVNAPCRGSNYVYRLDRRY